jgi:hydroxyacylglutathione hydrolase
VLDIPGHTAGHIAFHGHGALFCGDTLFSAGCGRVFEGTPAQMLASLDAGGPARTTPASYCGHEYTLANLRFARAVEPQNAGNRAARRAQVAELRDARTRRACHRRSRSSGASIPSCAATSRR